MPRPNAVMLGSDTDNAKRMTRSMMDQKNPSGIMLNNAFLNRKPAYYVYIYNASDKQFRIERPWAHPAVIIPPCEKGEAYSRPFIIPDIVAELTPTSSGSHHLAVNGVDGKFLAQDVVMPEVPQGSWETYRAIDAGNAGSFGTDLYKYGVWWSLTKNPEVDSEEVETARERLRRTYESLANQATQKSLEGEKGIASITPDMHRAADYLGITAGWHQRFVAKVECEGCGALINANIARHMPKELCGWVRNWPAAIRGTLATRAEAKAAGVELAEE